MSTTELFGLLRKIGESAEGDERHHASVTFFSALSKTIDGIHAAGAESEFRNITHYYGDTKTYTPAFKRYINSATEVFESAQTDSSKYVSIGRIFAAFRCGHKNYSERVKLHVLNLYRVRLYNKEIMLSKMNDLLQNIKKVIGGCDIGFEKHIVKDPRYQASRFASKVSATLQSVKGAADNFLFKDEKEITSTIIDSIETARDGAVNLARYEAIALCNMFKQKIVSSTEFKIEKQTNGLFWLTNPSILTALTTVNSIAISTSGVASKLGSTTSVKHMSDALHVAAAGLVSAALLPVAPAVAFVTAYLASKLSKTEIIQYLNNNARLREEFQAAINVVSGNTEECSYWKDKDDYVARHTRVGKMIQEYNDNCSAKYDSVVKMCDYFQNAYQIICADPILLGLNELSAASVMPQTKTKRLRTNKTARSNRVVKTQTGYNKNKSRRNNSLYHKK